MDSQHSDDSQFTLDLMAQLQDPHWALEMARVEEEAHCQISAGPEFGLHLGQFMADPYGFHQLQQLQSLVLHEFQRLLADGNLGVGADAAWSVGKQRLLMRLKQPIPDIQSKFKLVLAEDLATAQGSPLSAEAQAILQQTIYTVLTPDDWNDIAIAAANAVQNHVAEYFKLPKLA